MEDTNFIEKISGNFSLNGTVKNVYGEPVVSGDKTIIPVASIAYGFGGGFGKGKPPGKISDKFSEQEPSGEGAGGGGGLLAQPKGVYEITPSGTRFIPAKSNAQLIAAIAVGLLIRVLLKRRRNKA